MAYTVGVITASDKSSRGEREDLSGPRHTGDGAGGRRHGAALPGAAR